MREAVRTPWAAPADLKSGLHDAEYFYKQSERALRRQHQMLIRCGTGALVICGIVYCMVHFL